MNDYKKALMSKNGQMIVLLSREFLTLKQNDRIKTVAQYAEIYGRARGTIQSAMKFLQKENAISLEARGHLGTFITKLEYQKLWQIADFNTIMCGMPLPYSLRYEGLATGLCKSFEGSNMPFSLSFMRGANKRIEALRLEKYDLVIVSKLAADLAQRQNDDIEIIYEFPIGSYVGSHGIIFREKNKVEIEDGMRVALDTASLDQAILTSYECEGKEVEFVSTTYNQILDNLNNNEVDAAVWNLDEIEEKNLDFSIGRLKHASTKKINQDHTIATVVGLKSKNDLIRILKRFIRIQDVEKTQTSVINKEITPKY